MDACGVAVDFAGDVITSFLCKLTRRGSGGSSKGTARYRPCDSPGTTGTFSAAATSSGFGLETRSAGIRHRLEGRSGYESPGELYFLK